MLDEKQTKLFNRLWKYVAQTEDPNDCWEWTGCKSFGYGRVNLGRVKGASPIVRPSHRVLWELIHGPIAPKMEIDHRCHNRGCNNPGHLRVATHHENNRYQHRRKNNTSGMKGVCWDKSRNKWLVKIRLNYKQIGLGRFDTIEEAYAAWCEAAKKYHGDYACLD